MISKKSSIKNKESYFFRDSYRIIDANFNRAKEGLRVCEEICRFNLKNKQITEKIYSLRHSLTSFLKTASLEHLKLFKERDSKNDIGKNFSDNSKKLNFNSIFMANAQRVKEALRVLEEFLKIFDIKTSSKIQILRFKFYEIEKMAVEQFPDLLNS